VPLPPTLRQVISSTPLGLGGAPLGNLYRPLADSAARAVVATAWDAGVRYFDTAPHYGHGLSERRMGDALRERPREHYVLSSKVGRLLSADAAAPRAQHGYADVLPFVQRYDYSGAGFRRSLEDSLQRLGLARIDLVFVHDIDASTHGASHAERLRDLLDSGLPELARMKADGLIGGYGLGVNEVGICLATLQHADLDVLLLAGRYTLADQEALAVLLPTCVRRDVSVVLGGPFNSGILATGARPADGSAPTFNYAPAPPALVERVAAIERICAAHAVSLRAAALQFPRAHPAIACVLCGARTSDEIAANVASMRVPIPARFWTDLQAAGLLAADAPLPAAAT